MHRALEVSVRLVLRARAADSVAAAGNANGENRGAPFASQAWTVSLRVKSSFLHSPLPEQYE